MISDIEKLMYDIKEHATIDTLARKLYLTTQLNQFYKLKSLLSAFFVWAQLSYKPDSRYDTFLANILEEESLSIPKDISVISWNYDSQIETAYRSYNPQWKTVFTQILWCQLMIWELTLKLIYLSLGNNQRMNQ